MTSSRNDRRLLVLVADDSELQLQLERELLADQDVDFIVAHNGIEAIASARRFRPDVILLDIEMPVMDGIEAAQSLRRHRSTAGIPIIMVTSRGDARHMENAFVSGCSDYITKPVHKSELVAKIHSLTGLGAGNGGRAVAP